MLKINYPSVKKELAEFHQTYLKIFNTDTINNALTDLFKRNLKDFAKTNIEYILIAPIESLYRLSVKLNKKMNDRQVTILKQILNYDKQKSPFVGKQQPRIAQFFMDNSFIINISTCFFCNIDFINSINDIDDYQNALDFVKRASKKELTSIKTITSIDADVIISQRKKISAISQLTLPKLKIDKISTLDVKDKSNHFTLDHVLDKATHPIAALSLYNFVPCCYACNSKFKRSEELIKTTSLNYLSPTSKAFAFENDVRFKLFFPSSPSRTFKDIKSINDFVLNFEFDKNQVHYEEYLRIFRIKSRYVFHKKEALKLVDKRKNYSDSQIKEIAKITKQSTDQVKSDLFGSELFNDKIENTPFTKLRRDIARGIGITNAL